MTVPQVSIVIAAFNARNWICEAVDSALAQVEVACEVIVVDDGSTDGTAELLRTRYGDAIEYVYQTNRGLAAARNRGIGCAHGEYVQFLDADDVLLPSKVATHVAALEKNPDVSVAYSDFAYFVDGDAERTTPSGYHRRYRSGDVWAALIKGNFIVVHAALARIHHVRSAGCFDETLGACEDYDLWLRLAAQGHRFMHTPAVLALYRRRSGSMSSDRSKQIASTMAVLEKMSRTQTLGPRQLQAYQESVGQLQALMLMSMARTSLSLFRLCRYREAASAMLDAVKYDPLRLPVHLGRLMALGCERIPYLSAPLSIRALRER